MQEQQQPVEGQAGLRGSLQAASAPLEALEEEAVTKGRVHKLYFILNCPSSNNLGTIYCHRTGTTL